MNFIKIIKFDFMNIIKNPMLLIVNTIFPFILIGVMGLVTSGSFGAGNVSSFDYNGITMMIFVAFLIAMTASNTFMEEKVKRGNTRIIYAPVSKVKIYLSKNDFYLYSGQYFIQFHLFSRAVYLPYKFWRKKPGLYYAAD